MQYNLLWCSLLEIRDVYSESDATAGLVDAIIVQLNYHLELF